MDYEVIIIGAGIQGAAVAQATSAAGYRTLLLEQYPEPARATSSRSSKLIHGGLRYLESGQFALVRECLVERANLLRNAPHLVRLVPFHIPVYWETRRRPWKITAGLALYSLLSRKPFHRIPRSRWHELDGLKTHGLDAVFSYYDAQTDDAHLTRAVLASAVSLGCEIRFDSYFERADIQAENTVIQFRENGIEQTLSTCCLVNATGPWVKEVTEKFTPAVAAPAIELVQGTHIEIPGQPTRGMYYLEAPQDQRAVFVMPWKGHQLVGTTESLYQGDPADVQPLPDEINYLLTVYNHYFSPETEHEQVINAFAGLRVLPKGNGKAFSRPRDTLLVSDDPARPRVISLYGGKLTAQRATAADVLRQLKKSLPTRRLIADTRNLKLPDVP